MIKFIIAAAFFFSIQLHVFSQGISDSTFHKNSIKIDLVPFYNTFFDTRIQIRTGIEYEHYISKKSALACYLDFGLYDKYYFNKYYDFFNQNQGMYSVQQKVLIVGFHLLPEYNYYFYSYGKKHRKSFLIGAVLDMGYYHKNVSYYNTLTTDRSTDRYDQIKSGVGLSLGFKYCFRKNMFIEIKTSLVGKIFNYISENGRNPIKPLDAVWVYPSYNFWWISNIKIGYAFK